MEVAPRNKSQRGPGALLCAAFVAFVFLLSPLSSGVAESRHEEARIHLKARTIRPAQLSARPKWLSEKAAGSDQRPRHYIVQRRTPVTKEWRQKLMALSEDVVGYLPDNALILKAAPGQMARVAQMKEVGWLGLYLPEYKISPSLGTLTDLRHAAPLSPGERARLLVSLFPGGNPGTVRSLIGKLGYQIESSAHGRRRVYLQVTGPKTQIPAIAQIEDVEWIERHRPFVFAGGISADPLLAPPDIQTQIIRAPEVWDRGLTGAGQAIAICDTGLDVGINGTPLHDDFEGRIEAAYALGRPSLWNDPQGHGTHVAGTAVGNGTFSDGAFRAAAYESRLVFQSGYVSDEDPLGGVPVNLYELFEPVCRETSARIHSNSWGSPDRGAYSLFSYQVDEFVWDHKDFLILFAAGNDGADIDGDGIIDRGSLYSPATAKNCIAVGASENVRMSGGLSGYTWGYLGFLDGTWSALPISDDYVSDNEDGMAAFSSRGPCLDGRIKPDLVAPGTDIISCRSQDPQGLQSTATLSWGVYDDYYMYLGGTSMAAPAVASCAALVRQFYGDVKGLANPSAALIKATLINGAADMSPGQYGSGSQQEIPTAPNSVEGWGRVDPLQSLYPEGTAELQFADQLIGLETGQTETYEFVVGAVEVPFRATVTYSDYPSSPAAAINLVNDLDMAVLVPGGELIYPNGMEMPDDRNNVESVTISAPSPGVYQVTVSGTNVPQGPQPYALVVTYGAPTGKAAVSLDKKAYGVADEDMTITLIDADLPSSSSPTVTVVSDSDPFGVTAQLSVSATGAGVFEGKVALTTVSKPPTEGELTVSHGDTISAKYFDSHYGDAGSHEVVATATVDLEPPQIFDVTVFNVTENSATVGWSCVEPVSGTIEYGESRGLGLREFDRMLSESHSVTLSDLNENRVHYFSVTVRDPAGNEGIADNGGDLYTFSTRYTVSLFRDDMETGEGNWTHYGDADQWEYGAPAYQKGPPAAYSDEFCWGTRLAGYLEHDDFFSGTVRHEYLISPEINVGSGAKLSFYHWHDIIADYDYAYVEISANGGGWENVTPNPGGYLTGASLGWVKQEIDFSPFAGQIVQVRFHLEADSWFDDLGPDYEYAGWYIDDVTVFSTRAFGEPMLALNRVFISTAVPGEVTLVDGSLNTNPEQADIATVFARSTTETDAETIPLVETGTNTGIFVGSLLVNDASPQSGDGYVQVTEGDRVTVSFEGIAGMPVGQYPLIEVSAIVDLTPPAIADFVVSGVGTDRATVSFTTEATAVAAISYWMQEGEEETQVSRRRSTYREFALGRLLENTHYRIRVAVTDEAGNTASYLEPLDQFSFGTSAEIVVAHNGFDDASVRWRFASEEVWELGAPTFGPSAAHSAPNCWGTDLDGFYPITVDASLTSDWVTLPENPQLRFWHWYSIDEAGWEEAYGAVEVTADDASWETVSQCAGASGDWAQVKLDLSPWAGRSVRIRFRLWSEEAEMVLYYYAGWYIDDVGISNVVSYGQGTLTFDRSTYSLNVPVIVTLTDAHLNTDPLSKDTAVITLRSSLESIAVQLTETGNSTGRFTGTVYLREGPPAVSDEHLQVTLNDSITAEYHDENNGSGQPAFATASAPLDTTPPWISGVTVSEVTDTSALVRWTTDAPAVGCVSVAESPEGFFYQTFCESSYLRQHAVRVTGLSENVAYYVKVVATDEAENIATDDNGGGCYELRTMVRWEYFRDTFDRESKGWTHEGLGDVWQWGVPQYGVTSAHSSPDCWATNLTGPYPGQTDAFLVSPPLELKTGSRVSFHHWYNINEYALDDGEGTVEIQIGQGDWTPLDAGTFAGATPGWELAEFDLSSFGTETVRFRFRLRADQWIDFFYPGWYVDDVSAYCLRPFGDAVIRFDQETYCIPGPVTVTLKDADLNLNITEREHVAVSVTSDSDAVGITAELEETAENSAVFSGTFRLAASETPQSGYLYVQHGQMITARYFDAERPSEPTRREVTTSATVWTPPADAIVPLISYDASSKPALLTLSWLYEENRAYRLYFSDDLVGSPPVWQRVSGLPAVVGGNFMTFTETVSPLSRHRFYRIEVW